MSGVLRVAPVTARSSPSRATLPLRMLQPGMAVASRVTLAAHGSGAAALTGHSVRATGTGCMRMACGTIRILSETTGTDGTR